MSLGGSASEGEDKMTDAPSQPIQKRRRVTRACDECRRKKIKCDGKQPCTHCSVYSYGKPNHSRLVNPLSQSQTRHHIPIAATAPRYSIERPRV